MYEFDEDIDVFTIRYVNPNLMSLYGLSVESGRNCYVDEDGHINLFDCVFCYDNHLNLLKMLNYLRQNKSQITF